MNRVYAVARVVAEVGTLLILISDPDIDGAANQRTRFNCQHVCRNSHLSHTIKDYQLTIYYVFLAKTAPDAERLYALSKTAN